MVGGAAGCEKVGLRRIQVPAGGWSTPAHEHGLDEENLLRTEWPRRLLAGRRGRRGPSRGLHRVPGQRRRAHLACARLLGRRGLSRRAFVIVLDACGVGALPDAADYGDGGHEHARAPRASWPAGSSCRRSARSGSARSCELTGVAPGGGPGPARAPRRARTRQGLDRRPLGADGRRPPRSRCPTYPEGFPPEIVELVASIGGRERDLQPALQRDRGDRAVRAEHLRGGGLIVYTSQDSVLQIAAHVDVLDPAELYAVCAGVRQALPAEHAVGRVIARPFAGARRALAAHRRPPRLLGAAARPQLPRGAAGRRRRRSTRSARSGSCSPASGSTSSIRARPTRARSPRRPS